MSTGEIEFRKKERVRLLFLKHRGNIELVSKEAQTPFEYTKRLCDRFIRERKRDPLVGSTIAEYLMMGLEQRKAYIIEALNYEFEKQPIIESVCCKAEVSTEVRDSLLVEGGKVEYTICQACKKECITRTIDKRGFGLIVDLIEQLRKEDIAMVNFLVKLGYVDSEEGKPLTKNVNYNLYVGQKPTNDLSDGERRLLQNVEQLDPRTRETLRKNLERQIIDTAFENKDKR